MYILSINIYIHAGYWLNMNIFQGQTKFPMFQGDGILVNFLSVFHITHITHDSASVLLSINIYPAAF